MLILDPPPHPKSEPSRGHCSNDCRLYVEAPEVEQSVPLPVISILIFSTAVAGGEPAAALRVARRNDVEWLGGTALNEEANEPEHGMGLIARNVEGINFNGGVFWSLSKPLRRCFI